MPQHPRRAQWFLPFRARLSSHSLTRLFGAKATPQPRARSLHAKPSLRHAWPPKAGAGIRRAGEALALMTLVVLASAPTGLVARAGASTTSRAQPVPNSAVARFVRPSAADWSQVPAGLQAAIDKTLSAVYTVPWQGQPEAVGLAGGMERVAHEHQSGGRLPLRHGHRAHPPAHRPAPERDALRHDRQCLGQLRLRRADRGHQHLGPVRSPPPCKSIREIDTRHCDAGVGERSINGHQRRLVPSRARAGSQYQPGKVDHRGTRGDHQCIVAHPAGAGRRA